QDPGPVLHRGKIAPEKKCRHRAVGRPGLRQRDHFLDRRARWQTEAVMGGFEESKVASRANVGMSGTEEEIDFRSPGTYTLERNEAGAGLLGGEVVNFRNVEVTGHHGFGDSAERAEFAEGKADAAHLLFRKQQIRLRLQRAGKGFEAAPDGGGALDGQLLAAD